MAPRHERDFLDRYIRLEERVRRLETRGHGKPRWVALAPYLCGGWVDMFETGDNNHAAGYFLVNKTMFLFGTIQWDVGNLVTPPPAANAGELNWDSFMIARVDRDGLSRVAAGDDAGRNLPEETYNPYHSALCLPVDSTNSPAWMHGALVEVEVGGGVITANGVSWLINSGSVASGGGKPVDPTGYTHSGVPNGTALVLDGQFYRATGELETDDDA